VTPAAEDYILAARVPASLVAPKQFGQWMITRPMAYPDDVYRAAGHEPPGFPSYTILWKEKEQYDCREPREVVMEDSRKELRRHLPIWTKGSGRVLVTGLGLGCVVRGLLANPRIENVDVVEIDRGILDAIGPEFARERRVNLIEGDAIEFCKKARRRWDFAWHDLHSPSLADLTLMHLGMMKSIRGRVRAQGAWGLDRRVKRMAATKLELLA
jgi:hypothetical protein